MVSLRRYLGWKLKKEARSPLDFLMAWIVCTVWPGVIAYVIIFVDTRRNMIDATAAAVLVGFVVAMYLWYEKQEENR